jgi:phosphoesterase RecJ-like protein
MYRIARQIHSEIMRSNRMLLIPHKNPDGDAIGSCTAFMEWLKTEKKSYSAFCATPMTTKLTFLSHTEEISQNENVWQDPQLDLIIVFDSGDLRYAGVADRIKALNRSIKIIAFDHHATNENYGVLNFVDPKASSTCELMYRFFTATHTNINSTMATSLMTGLMTDTDNFTNGATSASALTIGHNLLMKGANVKLITGSVFKDKTVDTLKLWGLVLSRLEKHPVHDLAYTYLTQADLLAHDVEASVAEGISNFMNVLGESRMVMVLTEQADGMIKGSFRTTRDDTDVSAIAKALGGGGHKKAAGFTVPGPLASAFENIFQVMQTVEITN